MGDPANQRNWDLILETGRFARRCTREFRDITGRCVRGVIAEDWAIPATIALGVVCIAIYSSCCGACGHPFCHGSILLLMGLAAMTVGFLLGFLFGIPRTMAGSAEMPSHDDGYRNRATDYVDNTNLEQISDWLTKILVGVGLTQVNSIYIRMKGISAFAEQQLGYAPGSRAAGLAVMIFFFICGFLRAICGPG